MRRHVLLAVSQGIVGIGIKLGILCLWYSPQRCPCSSLASGRTQDHSVVIPVQRTTARSCLCNVDFCEKQFWLALELKCNKSNRRPPTAVSLREPVFYRKTWRWGICFYAAIWILCTRFSLTLFHLVSDVRFIRIAWLLRLGHYESSTVLCFVVILFLLKQENHELTFNLL